MLGLNGAGKTTLLRLLAGVDAPDTGDRPPRVGSAGRLLRPGARHDRRRAHRPAEHAVRSPDLPRAGVPAGASVRSYLFSGDTVDQPAAPCPAARRNWRSRRLVTWPRTCCCSTTTTTWTRPRAPRSCPRCRRTRGRWCSSATTRAPSAALEPRRVPAAAGRRRGPLERGLPRPRRTRLIVAEGLAPIRSSPLRGRQWRRFMRQVDRPGSRPTPEDHVAELGEVRVTGTERDRLGADLKKKYTQGASIRELAQATGPSYGFVHRVLCAAPAARPVPRRRDTGDRRPRTAVSLSGGPGPGTNRSRPSR